MSKTISINFAISIDRIRQLFYAIGIIWFIIGVPIGLGLNNLNGFIIILVSWFEGAIIMIIGTSIEE